MQGWLWNRVDLPVLGLAAAVALLLLVRVSTMTVPMVFGDEMSYALLASSLGDPTGLLAQRHSAAPAEPAVLRRVSPGNPGRRSDARLCAGNQLPAVRGIGAADLGAEPESPSTTPRAGVDRPDSAAAEQCVHQLLMPEAFYFLVLLCRCVGIRVVPRARLQRPRRCRRIQSGRAQPRQASWSDHPVGLQPDPLVRRVDLARGTRSLGQRLARNAARIRGRSRSTRHFRGAQQRRTVVRPDVRTVRGAAQPQPAARTRCTGACAPQVGDDRQRRLAVPVVRTGDRSQHGMVAALA